MMLYKDTPSRWRELENLLRKAKNKIKHPQNWIKGSYAEAPNYCQVAPWAPEATSWCALGAIKATASNHFDELEMTELIEGTIRAWENPIGYEDPARTIVNYNDTQDRKHKEVINIFDKAIQYTHEKGNRNA